MPDPELAQVFRLARKYIRNRSYGFICNALSDVAENHPKLHFAAVRAIQLVQDRMRVPRPGYQPSTLYSWLQHQRPYPQGLPLAQDSASLMREYRIQWLNHLIKEFS